ncbi:MAG: hypothetical protein HFJ40_06705 [Clostridia bacterium]|nr:hypothetical protein [Clostridia bacterium]
MRNLDNKLKNRAINYDKLLKYGFKEENDIYIYKKNIYDGQFEVNIVISDTKKYSKLIDIENEMEFALVDIEDSTGKFIGGLRKDYEGIIEDIIIKCTNKEVFISNQAKEIINYIKQKYNDELEYLWEKFDDNAIWRNKQNNKWYGALLIISESKLGIESDKMIEIIDLRYQKEKIQNIVDNKKVFPGYHMNKKTWITIKLDNSLDTETIYNLIDNSYKLSIGNKCNLTGNSLSQKVYDYLRTIPKGKVVTYKQVAEYIGNKGLARVIGNILHKNPDGDKYPCYKVLNSKGELAEAFVFGGKEIQKERLQSEGIKVINNKVDLSLYQWKEDKM